MPSNSVVTSYDDAGYPASASRTFPVTLGSLQVVRNGPGRLLKVSVTTATASAAVTVYDNASAASGTPLLVIPSGTAAGTLYDLNLPALAGITVQSTGATGNITVGYA